MPTTFRPYAPDQMLLMPSDLNCGSGCRRATWRIT